LAAGDPILDLSDLINISTGGNGGEPETIPFFKDARVGAAAATTPVIGRLNSLFEYNGQPSHGVPPTTAVVPTNTTAGGVQQASPGAGKKR
jgi:hypothetical protein